MATIFEASDGKKYVLPDNPEVREHGQFEFAVLRVIPYVEPQSAEPATAEPAPAEKSAEYDAANAPASVDDLATYREHNGDTPHADPAMRCQCAACKRVDRRA